MKDDFSSSNRLPDTPESGGEKNGMIVRIATALGSFLVVIVNDLGTVAGPLAEEIEIGVIESLRKHRHIVAEMATIDVQRGELDFESIQF